MVSGATQFFTVQDMIAAINALDCTQDIKSLMRNNAWQICSVARGGAPAQMAPEVLRLLLHFSENVDKNSGAASQAALSWTLDSIWHRSGVYWPGGNASYGPTLERGPVPRF